MMTEIISYHNKNEVWGLLFRTIEAEIDICRCQPIHLIQNSGKPCPVRFDKKKRQTLGEESFKMQCGKKYTNLLFWHHDININLDKIFAIQHFFEFAENGC